MHLPLSSVIPAVTLCQCLSFSIILGGVKGPKRTSNNILAVYFLVIAAHMSALLYSVLEDSHDPVHRMLGLHGMLYGPILFIYAESLINRNFRFDRKLTVHFIPAFAFLVASIGTSITVDLLSAIPCLSLVIYSFIIWKRIFEYHKLLQMTEVKDPSMSLNWLVWLQLFFSLTVIAGAYERFVGRLELFEIPVVFLLVLLFVNALLVKGFRQPYHFMGIEQDLLKLGSSTSDPIADLETDATLKILNQHMKERTPYRDPTFNLKALSVLTGISTRRISQTVNRGPKRQFASWANSFRIKEAEERFRNPLDNSETIQEVMHAVGYRSKSTFIASFKEHTGLTPSAYKKQIKAGKES